MNLNLLRLAVKSPRRYRRALRLYRALLPAGRTFSRSTGR